MITFLPHTRRLINSVFRILILTVCFTVAVLAGVENLHTSQPSQADLLKSRYTENSIREDFLRCVGKADQITYDVIADCDNYALRLASDKLASR